MQRFPLCFFSHHQNFPLQTLLGQSALLLQSLLFLVTPLYGSSSAPVPPYHAPFLRCRDTRSFLYTPLSSSSCIQTTNNPSLLLDTGFFSHPNFPPNFTMSLLCRNSASHGHCQIAARLPVQTPLFAVLVPAPPIPLLLLL